MNKRDKLVYYDKSEDIKDRLGIDNMIDAVESEKVFLLCLLDKTTLNLSRLERKVRELEMRLESVENNAKNKH